MASQLVATSGNRRLKRNQIAELEAKMPSLKGIQERKMRERMHEDEMAFKEKDFQQKKKMQKKSLALSEESSKRQMGVAAAKFGANMVLSGKHSTIGQIGTKIKGGLNKLGIGGAQSATSASNKGALSFQPPGTAGRAVSTVSGSAVKPTSGGGSFFGNLQPGNILGSGLAGFGASRMVKGKGKRMLLGAGVSGLMSLFGGGGLGSAGASALFGGLSGMLG